jgi:hypothetical protein
VLLGWAGNNRDYAEAIREYGLGTPRILSSFPRRKARKLRSYLLQRAPVDQQSLQSQRYVELVQLLTETVVQHPVINTGDIDWIDHLILEQKRGNGFDLVMTQSKERILGALGPLDIYGAGSPWHHPRQEYIARTLEGIGRVTDNFLKYATDKIFIVDPYSWNSRSIEVISNFIEKLDKRLYSVDRLSISIYYKKKYDKSNPGAGVVIDSLLGCLPALSTAMSINIKELDADEKEDVFHNRYILTHLGGVILGSGVDLSANQNHTDDAVLMDKSIYARRWNQYVDGLRLPIVSNASIEIN